MTEEPKYHHKYAVSELETITPAIFAAADEAARIVAMVEKDLVGKVGFHTEVVSEEVGYDCGHCVYLSIKYVGDENRRLRVVIHCDSEEWVFASAPCELKVVAVSLLPSLMLDLVCKTRRLHRLAVSAATVAKMFDAPVWGGNVTEE